MELVGKFEKHIQLCENPYQVADGADALILATMWNEFKQLDFARIKDTMKQPVVVDGRNLWDPEDNAAAWFHILRGWTL